MSVRARATKLICAVLLALSVPWTGGATSATGASAIVAGCQISTPAAAFARPVYESSTAAQVWRLYQAYFLRQPDVEGFAYWIRRAEGGMSLIDIANFLGTSDEFRQRYGTLDDRQFMDLIYRNVLCRGYDAEGYAFWLARLASGQSRPLVMLSFSESPEYMGTTGTRWSRWADPNTATMARDSYQVEAIRGGLVVKVDYSEVDFKTSDHRCTIASINANWFFTPDRPNPTPIGFAVINGVHVPGSVNTDDRGVFGQRWRPNGPEPERTWEWNGITNQSANLEAKNGTMLESWREWQPTDPSFARLDNPAEWRWAAAGLPLVINGQKAPRFDSLTASGDASHLYTHFTRRHSFVAFDKETGTLAFGSTVDMTSNDLIAWATQSGFENLIKFDGGGSVELNIAGQTRVAGTSRDVPVWLGLGC